MLKGLYTAYTGMINEQHRMDTMTNNLANATTVGYKKEGATSMSFDALLAYKIKDTTENKGLPRNIGKNHPGVWLGENYTDYSQGSFRETGNSLDLAIAGSGFYEIEYKSKGENGATALKYTRNGQFSLDQNGNLVTEDGDFVMGEGGHITLNPNLPFQVERDGSIYQNGAVAGKIVLRDFEDYNYIEKFGENLYQTVEGAVQKPATGSIRAGYLEMSNVQTVSEMVNLIAITRQYEANQKVVQTYDSSLEIAVSRLGKV